MRRRMTTRIGLGLFSLALIACGGGDGSPDAGDGSPDAGDGSPDAGDGSADAGDGSPDAGDGSPDAGDGACLPLLPPETAGIHVAPDGTASGDGTAAAPLDLATALSATSPAEPGDTLWLAAGTYLGVFASELEGTEIAPITVRPLPGARVILDSNIAIEGDEAGLTIHGEWTIYRGLEVLSSDSDRVSEEDSSSPSDVTLRSGITLFGANVTVANCVVHDTAQGFSFWTPAVDSELYGNIIYNNGWTAPGRGHGHAIYMQNESGTKHLEDNIIFFGFGTGVHAYTEGGSLQGFDVSNNVWFHTGASDPRSSQRKDGCLIGGFQPVARTTLTNNVSWSLGRGTRLGYGGEVMNLDATLRGNYLVEALWIQGTWDSLTLTDNTIYGDLQGIVAADYPSNDMQPLPPSGGNRIFVQVNRYDEGRARVAIFNFDDAPTVSVDLDDVLTTGEHYTVHSVFDLWGTPVAEGIYDGQALEFPMGTVAPPQPTGLPEGITGDDDPGTTFGTFIVTHTGCR